jgi:hypothetical protein
MGLPAISANGLLGKRVDAKRAGITTKNGVLGFIDFYFFYLAAFYLEAFSSRASFTNMTGMSSRIGKAN